LRDRVLEDSLQVRRKAELCGVLAGSWVGLEGVPNRPLHHIDVPALVFRRPVAASPRNVQRTTRCPDSTEPECSIRACSDAQAIPDDQFPERQENRLEITWVAISGPPAPHMLHDLVVGYVH